MIRRVVPVLTVLALGSACTPTPSPPTSGGSTPRPTPTVAVPTSTPSSSPTAAGTTKKTGERSTLPRGGRQVFPRHRVVGPADGWVDRRQDARPARNRAPRRAGRRDSSAGRNRTPSAGRSCRSSRSSPRSFRTALAPTACTGPGCPTRRSSATSRRLLKHAASCCSTSSPAGRDFIPEVRAYERWLVEPDVGVALDPGLAMGRTRCRAGCSDTPRAPSWIGWLGTWPGSSLAKTCRRRSWSTTNSPPGSSAGSRNSSHHKGIVLIKSVDGIGLPAAKIPTYRVVIASHADVRPPRLQAVLHRGQEVLSADAAQGGSRPAPTPGVRALRLVSPPAASGDLPRDSDGP